MADIYLAIIACRLTGAGAVSRRVRGRDRGEGDGATCAGRGAAPAQVRLLPHCVSSTRFS